MVLSISNWINRFGDKERNILELVIVRMVIKIMAEEGERRKKKRRKVQENAKKKEEQKGEKESK